MYLRIAFPILTNSIKNLISSNRRRVARSYYTCRYAANAYRRRTGCLSATGTSSSITLLLCTDDDDTNTLLESIQPNYLQVQYSTFYKLTYIRLFFSRTWHFYDKFVRKSLPNDCNLLTAIIVDTAALNLRLALYVVKTLWAPPKSRCAKTSSSTRIQAFSSA